MRVTEVCYPTFSIGNSDLQSFLRSVKSTTRAIGVDVNEVPPTPDELLEQKSLAAECNQKEWAFVREYIIDLNGTQAVWRAGCFRVSDDNSASNCASLLLRRPRVQAALAVVKAQRMARVGMTADSVLSEMAALAHSDIQHYTVDDDGKIQLVEGAPANAMSAIQSIKHKKTIREDKDGNVTITHDVEIKLWDKPAPLRLMGKHVGLFPDRMEHTGKDGKAIETVSRIERVVVRTKKEDAA